MYKGVYDMANDNDLLIRIAGCVATQTFELSSNIQDHPVTIAGAIQWKCAGQPGWAEAYDYAVNSNVDKPGLDEGVITDAMILSAVQAVLGVE